MGVGVDVRDTGVVKVLRMGEERKEKSGKHKENPKTQRDLGFFRKSGEMGKIGMGNGWGGYIKCIQGCLCRIPSDFLLGRKKIP